MQSFAYCKHCPHRLMAHALHMLTAAHLDSTVPSYTCALQTHLLPVHAVHLPKE